MLRFALSAVILAGASALAQPVFADPVTPPEAQTTAAEPASPAPVIGEKNASPVGFGWG